MMVYYYTTGPVRGSCGHKHRSERTSRDCIRKDDRAVKRGHGPSAYSDRAVRKVTRDGDDWTDAPVFS